MDNRKEEGDRADQLDQASERVKADRFQWRNRTLLRAKNSERDQASKQEPPCEEMMQASVWGNAFHQSIYSASERHGEHSNQ